MVESGAIDSSGEQIIGCIAAIRERNIEMRMYRSILLITLLLLCSLTTAHAHLRDYLVTYGYWVPPKGMIELEIYNDFNETDSGDTMFVNQTELEYGVTDRMVLGLYAVSEKVGNKPLEYAKTKLRAQYQLAEYRKLPVDPGLYLEYQWGANNRADKIEAKLLMSRDFGKNLDYNVSLNGILEKSSKAGSEWEAGYAFGMCKVINPKITAGLELKSIDDKSYIIPGAYITVGKGTRFNVGTAFGLTDKADDFQLKTLMEFEFF